MASGPTLVRGKRLFQRAKLPLSINRHFLRGDFQPHDHDFLEIALVTAGRATHRTVHGDRSLGRGDAVVLRPGAWHGYRRCRGLAVVNCCFAMSLLREQLAWAGRHPRLGLLVGPTPEPVLLHLPEPTLRRCRATLTAMEQNAAHDNPATDLHQLAGLLQLLAHLAECIPDSGARPTLEPRHPAVIDTIEWMEQDLRHPWTLAELAVRAGVAPAYLVRLFTRHVGRPPMAHLAAVRLERAAALLLRTDQQIGRIAQQVGYDDANYFARRFHRHFGQSPTAYRQRRAIRTVR